MVCSARSPRRAATMHWSSPRPTSISLWSASPACCLSSPFCCRRASIRPHRPPSRSPGTLSSSGTPMNRKTKIILIGGIAAWAVAAVLVDRALVAGRQMQRTNDAYSTADFPIVAPKVSGLIDRVEIDDNDHVRAGQELAHIDDRDYRTALFHAEAALARAQADVEILSAQLSRQQAVIDQAD